MSQDAKNIAIQHVGETELTVKKTYCRICLGLCGLNVTTDGDRIYKIEADKDHLYNWQDFCHKGKNAERVRSDPRRITKPMKRVGDVYVESTYEEAIADIAARLTAIREKYGANAIGAYAGNPGVSNSTSAMFHGAFMNAIGTANTFHVGSIDQNNLHLVSNKMYGSEAAMLIPDIDNAECILLVGANPAVSVMCWVDSTVNGWKRIKKRIAEGLDLIVVDPHVTATSIEARSHVQVKPGQDWAFLLTMISFIFEHGWENKEDCADATNIQVLRDLAGSVDRAELSKRCAVPLQQIEDLAQRFATARSGFCVTRTGVAINRNGTIGEWMGQALNLICGRIDRKGGRYWQPGIFENSMQVMNSMGSTNPRPSRIGGYQQVAGAYPLAILADEITTPGDDQIRAVFICAGNPVVSGPHGEKLDAAFADLDLLVSFDLYQRESHRHAHWLIPGLHYLEREDLIAMFSMMYEKPFIQFAQPVVSPPDQIIPEWQVYLEIAMAMNLPLMGMENLKEVVEASRTVAEDKGDPSLAFGPRSVWSNLINNFGVVNWEDIVATSDTGLYYRDLEIGTFRSQLQTSDGKINAAPEEFVAIMRKRLREPLGDSAEFPFQLITQRRRSMMNSWLAEFNDHRVGSGNLIDINPRDAADLGVHSWQKVIVSSSSASLEVYAKITDEVPAGVVSMDHGWGSRLFDPKTTNDANVEGVNRNALVGTDTLDELSGTPNLNGASVNVVAANAVA